MITILIDDDDDGKIGWQCWWSLSLSWLSLYMFVNVVIDIIQNGWHTLIHYSVCVCVFFSSGHHFLFLRNKLFGAILFVRNKKKFISFWTKDYDDDDHVVNPLESIYYIYKKKVQSQVIFSSDTSVQFRMFKFSDFRFDNDTTTKIKQWLVYVSVCVC